MRVALMGYGKMGKQIEEIARQREHEIVACIDSVNTTDLQAVAVADVCFEFTSPESAVNNIKKAARLKKNIVVGSTGWYEHLPEVEALVKESGIGLIYAPNFSIGVYLFGKMVEAATSLIAPFEEYDVAGIEIHHRAKLDCPSGTANSIGQIVQKNISRAKEFIFTGVRVGHAPGTHQLIFDSAADSITITHEAKNRKGFALGAVIAAEWLQGKRGVFTMDHLLGGQNVT